MRNLKFIFVLLFMVSSLSFADNRPIQAHYLFNAAIATGTSASIKSWGAKRTFYVNGATSAGAGAVTVLIEVSNVDSPSNGDWVLAATVSLVLSPVTISDGFASDAAWKYARARISAIAGTDATVNVIMAAE